MASKTNGRGKANRQIILYICILMYLNTSQGCDPGYSVFITVQNLGLCLLLLDILLLSHPRAISNLLDLYLRDPSVRR
jgi:hypothetical protein